MVFVIAALANQDIGSKVEPIILDSSWQNIQGLADPFHLQNLVLVALFPSATVMHM